MFKTHGIPIQILSVYKSASDIAANKPLHVTAAVSDTTRTALSTRVVDLDDPRFVYAVCRAVTADCPNKNGDMFTAAELKRAYPSFVGCNLFLDHKTSSVRDAVGKIVAAEYIDNDKSSEHPYVATLIKIDAVNRPDIAGMVKTGTIDSVSMGANVQESECLWPWAKVFTPDGPVRIADLEVGDYVLTHKGHFKPVIHTFKNPTPNAMYRVSFADGCSQGRLQNARGRNTGNFLDLTGNHPVLVEGRGWVLAQDIHVGDKVYCLTKPCANCGAPILYNYKRNFCSTACKHEYIQKNITDEDRRNTVKKTKETIANWTSEEREKHHRVMSEAQKNKWANYTPEQKAYYSHKSTEGINAFFVSDRSLDERKRRSEYQKQKWKDPEFAAKISDSLNRIRLGLTKTKRSALETKVEEALICRGYTDFITNLYIHIDGLRMYPDFVFKDKKIVIEVDGEYWHSLPGVAEKDIKKTQLLERNGYTVLRFTGTEISKELDRCLDVFERVYKNHSGQYIFTPMEVLGISKRDTTQKDNYVYNISVADDESYVAENLVVHNCSICGNRASKKEDFCYHLQPENLGRQDFNTGKIACSINHGVEFTELSLVSVPADPTAKMHQVFAEAKQNMKVTAAPMEAMQGAPSAMPNPAAPMPAATPDPIGGGAPGQEDNKPVDPNKELQGPLGEEDEIENHDEDVDAEFTTEKDDNGQVLEGYNFICKSNETADAIFNLLSSYKGEGVLNVAHKGLQVNVSFVPGLVPDKENFISQIFKSTKEYKVQFKKPVVDSEGSNNEDEEQSTEENKTVTSAASATDTVMKVTAKNNEKETTMDTRKITAAEEDFNKEDEELEDTAAETEDKAESEAKTAKEDAEEADKEADKAESEAETAKDDAEDAEAEDKKEEAKKDIKEALKNLSPEEVDEILNEVKGEKGAGSADANMGEDGDNSLTPLDVDMTNDNNAAAEQVPGVDEKMGEEPMNLNTPKNPFPGKEDEGMNVTGEGEAADMPNTINASAMQAELKTGMDKTASLADSTWVISRKADYGTILSFPIKAAFGADIANDKNRLEYATSQKFGDAVVASLASGNIKSQADAELAILKLAAHYTPSHPSVNQFKTEEKSKHGKNSEKVENKTYKDMGCQEAGKEIKASVKDGVRKVVAACDNGAGKEGDQGNQMEQNVTDKAVPMIADSAQTHPASTNTSPVESGHPKASQKIEDGVYKAMAALEEKIKLQAAEIAEKSRKIANLQARIDFNIKANEVKDVIQLMASKGMIARDESVFNNALSRGLDLKAAHAAAMKAAISAQQKELLQLSSPALQAFASSITKLNVTASQPIAKSAALDKPFKVQASYEAPSEADMMARYEKILDFSKRK